ncbi:MAG: DmsC/YnfH family molybdoenzyme membrane anchor subunit [Rhodovibrionaceae bacterium]|nr:DmsC/YnfH family molybdoenzyme membrane anchor subunit [Rhodovibrionaceae bacterium]
MHPAPSIIVFTTLSGAGYGLLFWLGVMASFDRAPDGWGFALAGMGLALALVSIGLLASTLHLKHPERAWRAVTQWRSSWLSREGVLALATYGPAGALAVAWVVTGEVAGLWRTVAALAALGALGTVVATAMIYASLKPVRTWHSPWTLPGYLAFAGFTGALLLAALLEIFALPAWRMEAAALVLGAAAWGVKLVAWRHIDGPPPTLGAPTAESATGLGDIGRVRLLERPHTGESYLTREMAFRVARKHARRLRAVALLLGGGVAGALLLLALALSGPAATLAAVLAAICGILATLIERWLFFAEARHTVTLYYGARQV